MRFEGRRVAWPELASLVAIVAAVWLLWPTFVVYPLKILVVLFHELSHGAAAIATGGRIESIEVVAREGGVCVTLGGNRFLTLSAGYLGSLVWGGLLLVIASRSRGEADRYVTAVLAVGLLASALLWVRPLLSFGFAFSLLASVALVAAAAYLPAQANDYLLKTIGLTSVLYAWLDIRDDILRRPHLLESDAAQLAQLTGLPTLFWGGLWILAATLAAAGFLVVTTTRSGDEESGTPPTSR